MSEFTKLSSVLHTLSCTLPHAERMEEMINGRDQAKCYFYLEETFQEDEDMPDHLYWESVAEDLCKELNSSPSEVLRFIINLLNLRSKLDTALDKIPNGAKLARQILFAPPGLNI